MTNEPNNFKYNGKEEITDLGVNWYDYGTRMYIPEIGRWNGIDANQEGTLYKGYSENIIQRGEAHNNGLRKYTAGKGPWKLVFVKSFTLKTQALKFEKMLKRQNRKYLCWIINESEYVNSQRLITSCV